MLENFAAFFGVGGAAGRASTSRRTRSETPVGAGLPGRHRRRPAPLHGVRHGAAPAGRAAMHWASAETSNYWNGYMDGAVRSGKRAAKEVMDEL